MKKFLVVALLGAMSLTGQDPKENTLPVVRQAWDELLQYLVLSTGQMASLQQIMNERARAEQAIYEQIAEKERQLYSLLGQGSNDSGTIGRLMVEINNLRRQPFNHGPYRAQALAVLNEVQKAKLANLSEALQLQNPAWQAVQLNLIDRPAPDPRILPFPMPVNGPVLRSETARSPR